jgi:V-type H+-transporting ATPase subunit H
MQEFLRTDPHRIAFVEQDCLNLVCAILREHSQHHQVLYQGLYCLWLTSFYPKIAMDDIPNSTAIDTIVTILKNVATDKVIRISVAVFRNIVDRAHNNELILERGFARILAGLLSRRWGDEDVTNDLQIVDAALQKNIAKQSSFDSYQQELISGDLVWSPCHKSERFWKENVARFEENKCRVLGLLIQIIKTSKDPQILSIAIHDLGEFARFHPRGRQIIAAFPDLKATIMKLLDDPEVEATVQSQALLCAQKIMVQNWEFLPSGSS